MSPTIRRENTHERSGRRARRGRRALAAAVARRVVLSRARSIAGTRRTFHDRAQLVQLVRHLHAGILQIHELGRHDSRREFVVRGAPRAVQRARLAHRRANAMSSGQERHTARHATAAFAARARAPRLGRGRRERRVPPRLSRARLRRSSTCAEVARASRLRAPRRAAGTATFRVRTRVG